MKEPKNLDKYEKPLVAGVKLISLAIHHILVKAEGVRIRWEIKVSYWDEEWTKKPSERTGIVAPVRSTFSNK